MSTCFDIVSSDSTYPVEIGRGQFAQMLRETSDEILIADEWFAAQLAEAGRDCLLIPASESSKSLDAIPQFVIALRQHGANRQTRLVALGGGIVQDVVAFIASVYMRGVSWRYFPSTLLAMVDSCIGGKSSINVGPYKNLVGTYHPPSAVVVDPTLALSLDDEKRISGLIEAVKICFCRGEEAFQQFRMLNPQTSMSADLVEQLAECSLRAKKWFIEIDEFDSAERLLLNFGHTFGHAIEGASHFEIEHGIGVGIGILCALEMGRLLGRRYEQLSNVQWLEQYLRQLLSLVPTLRNRMKRLSVQDVLDRFGADKKHRTTFYTVILISESGAVELFRQPRDEAAIKVISNAVERTLVSFEMRPEEIMG